MTSVFNYTARNGDGRFVAGAVQGESAEHVLEHLRARALFVTSLEKAQSTRGALTGAFSMLPVSVSAKLTFFRSFATLIGSGISVRRALEVTIEECRDGRLSEALRSIASDIESGQPLSAATARRPREFPRLLVAMLRAGEAGGALDQVLARVADLMERDHALRKRLTAALTYPAIVTVAAAALVIFLIADTAPAFAGMFAEMHVQLPLSTRILLCAGTLLKSPAAWAALPVLAAGVITAAAAARASRMRAAADVLKLRLPIAGPLLRNVIAARFARTLGMLLRSGVALIAALEAAEDVVGNMRYARALAAVRERLREGEPLTAPLTAAAVFDPVFLQLVRAGEETGTLDTMLLRLADHYDLEVESALAALGSALEPLLILVLGAVVGTIVASILIPLYSLIGSMK